MKPVYFVSGHLSLTAEEFLEHYIPKLEQAVLEGATFVVGEARGADRMAQDWLAARGVKVSVFHMFTTPRHAALETWSRVGGFTSDEERDAAMTAASTHDIAWVRPGSRPNTGTEQNLRRRAKA